MSQYVSAPTKSYQAGEAIAINIRVKLSSGNVVAAGVADDWIGTTEEAALASGDFVAIRLRTAEGTQKYTTAGAVTAGARVYAAAAGKVDDAITTELIGIALEAATASGDVIEVLNVAGGQSYRIARGEVTLDGSNPTPVTTGLNTIVAGFVTLKSSSAPGDDPSWASVDYTGSDGTLNVYAWKNTGGTDPTLVASTNSSAVFCWVAIGT